MALPPGPRLPALLQTFNWIRRPIPFLEECARRYGDFFTLRVLGFEPVVVCSHPATIRRLFLEGGELFHAGEPAAILEPLVGPSSLLLLDGAAHMRQRRLMLPSFHGARMKAYAETMREITAASVAAWPRDTPFAMHEPMQQITLQVILRTVFGLREGAQMQRLGSELTRLMNQGQNPRLLVTVLPFATRAQARFLRQRATVDAIIYDEIARRRAEAGGERTDVMSLMLSAVDEEGNGMSDSEVRDELLTLLAAGHETTATSLAWTFERVLSRRAVCDRLRGEIDRVLGGAPVTDEHLPVLEYLDAVIKESLRLRPIIPMVVRKLGVPMMIHGFELPAGTVVAPNIYLTHRLAHIYPDPERFEPERFLGVKPDPYSWFPFGGGIRRCLGMAFALYEMKIVLATVLQEVELGLAPASTGRVARRAITFAPSDGARVIVQQRRRAAAIPAAQAALS